MYHAFCRDLEVLNLSSNNIMQLPAPLFMITKLQELNVSHNKISQLCDSLEAMESLQVRQVLQAECHKEPRSGTHPFIHNHKTQQYRIFPAQGPYGG